MFDYMDVTNNRTPNNYLGYQWSREDGYCLDADGNDQNIGVEELILSAEVHPNLSKEDCLAECKTHTDSMGCEWSSTLSKCYYHATDVASGSGDDGSLTYCWIR